MGYDNNLYFYRKNDLFNFYNNQYNLFNYNAKYNQFENVKDFIEHLRKNPNDIEKLEFIHSNIEEDDIKDIIEIAGFERVLFFAFDGLKKRSNEKIRRDIIYYVYRKNINELQLYLEKYPMDYLYFSDFWVDYKVLLENASERTTKFLLFDCNYEIVRRKDSHKYCKMAEVLIDNKIDFIINYLNSNPAAISRMLPFMMVSISMLKGLLKKLNEETLIKFFLADLEYEELFSGQLTVFDAKIEIFNLIKEKIFKYVEENNLGYEKLLFSGLTEEEAKKIVEITSEDKLIQRFIFLGSKYFKENKDILETIYSLKKELILERFVKFPDDFVFVLALDIPDDDFILIIDKLDSESLNMFIKNSIYPWDARREALKQFFNSKQISIDYSLIEDLLAFWNKIDYKIIIDNYTNINKIISLCGFSLKKMFQYEANSSFDWLNGLNEIIKSDNIDNFIIYKNKLFDAYFNFSSDKSGIQKYEWFLILVENFNKYPDLCIYLGTNQENLTEDELNKLLFLFSRKEKLIFSDYPNKLDGINNVIDKLKAEYIKKIEDLNRFPNSEIKLLTLKRELSLLLFNTDYDALKKYLATYGNREDFLILRFNNRNNQAILKYIDEILVYISFIEDFVNCNDLDILNGIATNGANNYNEIINDSMIFNSFKKKMRDLFEMEANANLTNLSDKSVYNKAINRELTEKYGVEVLDFRDKKYVFYIHSKSNSESIDELVLGISSGMHNFISLSPSSHRDNKYYGYNRSNSLRFVYDKIKSGNYIISSTVNMATNSRLTHYRSEVAEIDRKQVGILQTSSDSDSSNPETLCYREGLIPVGLVFSEEDPNKDVIIKIAKENHLKLIMTQEWKKSIANPISIDTKSEEQNDDFYGEKIDSLRKKMDRLANFKKSSTIRKIAILADPHALFEPTLAILEDARREGITEIYSLGDNIGTGPNPGEVVDLLESYGVKSVKGNHELYTLIGTEAFKNHLHGDALEEAEENSNWTRLHLTDRQLEIIREYPDKIELNINGKKVLLTHYIKDLNTDKVIYDKDKYDQIFQGHIHYKSDEDNISTLRGAGIGSKSDNKKAYYIILTEKDNGGFDIEEKYVSFDLKSLYHDINESSLSEHDKNKISSWAGVIRR